MERVKVRKKRKCKENCTMQFDGECIWLLPKRKFICERGKNPVTEITVQLRTEIEQLEATLTEANEKLKIAEMLLGQKIIKFDYTPEEAKQLIEDRKNDSNKNKT
jgi:hypothetical protein